MDKYTYLLIPLFLFIPWLIIFLSRTDLREKIIKAGVFGAPAGVIAEFWYFADYWQPPLIFENSVFMIEDLLAGFFITGVTVSVYDMIFTEKNIREEKNRKMFFLGLFVLGTILLLIFNNGLGINSIFVSSFAFILLSIAMVAIRKDLLIPSIVSGILTLLIITPIYGIIFNYISPEYWNSYWLLSETKFGLTIFGNIPVTELLWYFSWGCLAGIGYDFASGTKKIHKSKII